jgi:ABC-type transport system substrate-binding protein
MRTNNGLDPRAPTNGRMLDAEDMAFSWRKFEQISTFRGTLSNNASKDAPVQSVTVVDKNTVRLKMAFPDADFLFLFGEGYWVQPREAESQFDPKGTIRGSGPLMMTEHRPSALAVYEKNPGAYDAATFNIDKVELPVVPEAATRLSQFRAGNVYAFGVPQQDIVQTKKDIPELDLYSNGLAGLSTQAGFAMVGWLEGSPFRDARVRQALSMAIDEEAFISTFYNKDILAAAGLDVEVFYNSPSTTAADRP